MKLGYIRQISFVKVIFTLFFILNSCAHSQAVDSSTSLQVGAEQTAKYFPLLQNKSIALVSNHSSKIADIHLVDSLLSAGFEVKKVFSPEHGFRGDADAGEKVKNQIDEQTGLPIISLYGDNKKPYKSQLEGIDLLLFDMQDVGARFYTYISTLHYVMEAAAENEIPLIILDRPNPNGNYVDGPVLDLNYKSFVGMHPVPIVHGMTIGEYARMINGEGWLKNGIKCDLQIISCENYQHSMPYEVPIPPSPNLPNSIAINWYPSLCLFEGTVISVGRGTEKPFQQIGHPALKNQNHSFTPRPGYGAKNPKLKGETCYGQLFSSIPDSSGLKLEVLINCYRAFPNKDAFFNSFFTLLAGNKNLQKDIESGKSAEEIKSSWKNELEEFLILRKKYLLYPE